MNIPAQSVPNPEVHLSQNVDTMPQKTSHRERLVKFVQSCPEFESEETLHKYYLAYEGPEGDEQGYLVQFWREILMSYQQQVTKSFRLKQSQVVKDLTLQQRVPVAIPAIIRLQMDSFVPRFNIQDGSHYGARVESQNQGESGYLYSFGAYLGNKLYDNTVGYLFGNQTEKCSNLPDDPTLEDCEYINVEMLEKFASGIQRWVDENRKEKNLSVVEESTLRKMVRKILYQQDFVDIEENIDLIFNHLRQTGRLAQGTINMTGNSDTKIIKIAPIGQTFQSAELLPDEKAPFQLKEMIVQLDQDIQIRSQRVVEMNTQIKQLGKRNEKEAALRLLRQRKDLEKFLYRQRDKKYSLETTLLSIEQGQQDIAVFQSLKAAKEAGKQQNKGGATGTTFAEELEDLMTEIREQQDEQDQVGQAFADGAIVGGEHLNDADLLNELEQLEKKEGDPVDRIPAVNKAKVGGLPSSVGMAAQGQGMGQQDSISDLERRLRDLDAPISQNVPQVAQKAERQALPS